MDSQRLFLALPLPAPVREVLAALQGGSSRFRWTPVDQLHVTLRFVGDVFPDQTAGLIERLQSIHVKSFVLPVEGTGAFPAKGSPRVLWVGVGGGHPRLHQLRQRVDDAVLSAGVPMDVRAFHPHVTLARCAEGGSAEPTRWLRANQSFAGPAFTVEAFELYASELLPFGPVHTLVATFPLLPSTPHIGAAEP